MGPSKMQSMANGAGSGVEEWRAQQAGAGGRGRGKLHRARWAQPHLSTRFLKNRGHPPCPRQGQPGPI